MVRRSRRRDGAPVWGCSRFPDCRGIVDIVSGPVSAHGGWSPRDARLRAAGLELRKGLIRFVLLLILVAVFWNLWMWALPGMTDLLSKQLTNTWPTPAH